MRFCLFFCFMMLSLSDAAAQTPEFVWTAFDTSENLDVKKFSTLNVHEKKLIEAISKFADNRARLTLTDNENPIYPRELRQTDFPIVCGCRLKNDTLYITAAAGFMGVLGIQSIVTKEQFGTKFFQEADNTNVFKLYKSDTLYSDRISVPAKKQRLTLSKRPLFKNGETIFGKFEGEFQHFMKLTHQTFVQEITKQAWFLNASWESCNCTSCLPLRK